MTDIHVTQADREAAADLIVAPAHRADIRGGLRDNHGFVQAFARHRIEAARQAEEQIKLLREALEAVAPILEGIVNDGAADIQDGCLDRVTDEMRDCGHALQTLAALEATNG